MKFASEWNGVARNFQNGIVIDFRNSAICLAAPNTRAGPAIMLDCCENLFKKYPRMFFITLHDSIKCLPKDEQKVRDELERSWKKYLVSPKFETETYGPSNK